MISASTRKALDLEEKREDIKNSKKKEENL